MRQFVILCSATGEEARLTLVKVETLETAVPMVVKTTISKNQFVSSERKILIKKKKIVPKSNEGISLANIALGLMPGVLRGCQTMKHR